MKLRKTTIERKVKEAVAYATDTEVESVELSDTWEDYYGMDSIDKFVLLLEVERKFGIEIPDEDAAGMESVNDLVMYISKRV